MFRWNFPLLGTYWSGADIAIQHIGKEIRGGCWYQIISLYKQQEARLGQIIGNLYRPRLKRALNFILRR